MKSGYSAVGYWVLDWGVLSTGLWSIEYWTVRWAVSTFLGVRRLLSPSCCSLTDCRDGWHLLESFAVGCPWPISCSALCAHILSFSCSLSVAEGWRSYVGFWRLWLTVNFCCCSFCSRRHCMRSLATCKLLYCAFGKSLCSYKSVGSSAWFSRCVYVFCTDLRTNSDFCLPQH
jgi:hypothetical protein